MYFSNIGKNKKRKINALFYANTVTRRYLLRKKYFYIQQKTVDYIKIHIYNKHNHYI